MNFGTALEAMKHGKSVARRGWCNYGGFGPRIYIELGSVAADHEYVTQIIAPIKQPKELTVPVSDIEPYLYRIGFEGTYTRLPQFVYHNGVDTTSDGWVPTQHDMLAEDWFINTQALIPQQQA